MNYNASYHQPELFEHDQKQYIRNDFLKNVFDSRKADLNLLEPRNMLYYPAAGTDIQPLLRFSHSITHVLAPNLSDILTNDEYIRRFRIKCHTLNQYYRQRLLTYQGCFKLEANNLKEYIGLDSINIDRYLIFSHDKKRYLKTFNKYYDREIEATAHVFRRHYHNYHKDIVWITINTEGLATLLTLYKEIKESPKIIVTIQSGVLEHPRGLLYNTMLDFNIDPDLWVRGYWGDPSMRNFHESERRTWRHVAQKYNNWYSPLGVIDHTNEENPFRHRLSIVRAYSKTKNIEISKLFTNSINSQRKIYIHNVKLTHDDAGHFDVVFGPEWIVATMNHAISLESLSKRNSRLFPNLLFREILDYIQEYSLDNKYKRIALVPIGYEDEISMIPFYIEQYDNDLDLTIFVDYWLDANTGDLL